MARLLPCGGYARFILPVLVAGVALIGSTGASAGPATSTTMPFLFEGVNTCTGEAFSGTGNLHLLISGTLSNSGNAQTRLESNLSGVQATTLSGKKYVAVNQESNTLIFDSDLMPFVWTIEHTMQFVRSGEQSFVLPNEDDDDWYEKLLFHVTVNANNVVTVDKFELDGHCK